MHFFKRHSRPTESLRAERAHFRRESRFAGPCIELTIRRRGDAGALTRILERLLRLVEIGALLAGEDRTRVALDRGLGQIGLELCRDGEGAQHVGIVRQRGRPRPDSPQNRAYKYVQRNPQGAERPTMF